MRSNQASPRARGPAYLITGASATSSCAKLFSRDALAVQRRMRSSGRSSGQARWPEPSGESGEIKYPTSENRSSLALGRSRFLAIGLILRMASHRLTGRPHGTRLFRSEERGMTENGVLPIRERINRVASGGSGHFRAIAITNPGETSMRFHQRLPGDRRPVVQHRQLLRPPVPV
jgi:hypothetical protein